MKGINPDYFAALQRTLGQSPYFDLLGMELTSLSLGQASFRLMTGTRHTQPWGVAHGGALASVLDAAAFWAVYSSTPDKTNMTTTDLMVKYLAPVVRGMELDIRGETINLGRTLGLGQARALDTASGRLVAHASSTLIHLDAPLPEVLADLPPKFVEAD